MPLTIAAVAALPVGIAVLVHVPTETLRLGISITILLLVGILASGWRYRGSPSLPITLGVGAASGALGGSTGMIGPPVILFWLGGQNNAALVRANINAFFGLMILITIIAYWIGGLFTPRSSQSRCCWRRSMGSRSGWARAASATPPMSSIATSPSR